MSVPASNTGGVKAFSLQGRLYLERERLTSMTEEERAWRAQWLKDQVLAPDEPRIVPELQRQLKNPIRKAYQMPLDGLARALTPVMGKNNAWTLRFYTGKFLMGIAFVYAATYYFKYNTNDWTKKGAWRIVVNRTAIYPDQKNFPEFPKKNSPSEYNSLGFENSPI